MGDMRFTIENIVIVLSLMLFEAWFLKGYFSGAPEYEPVIGIFVTLGALFTKDKLKGYFGVPASVGTHDLELFTEFQNTFPSEPTIRLLKETDFGASFRKEEIQPLYDFVEKWGSVEKEFLNKSLEKQKKILYAEAKILAAEFGGRTTPIGNGDLLSVFPDFLRDGPRPDHVIIDAKILNKQTKLFAPKYESFVRKCRATLKT